MQAQIRKILNQTDDEQGASLVEYALLVGLIALVCIAAVGFIGTETQQPYSELASHLR